MLNRPGPLVMIQRYGREKPCQAGVREVLQESLRAVNFGQGHFPGAVRIFCWMSFFHLVPRNRDL